MTLAPAIAIDRRDVDGAIFDLDGVLTATAGLHAAAWKATFDAFLHRWSKQRDVPFRPFDIGADYLAHVDGRPREDGIRSFLSTRGIDLPEGSGHDPDDADTIQALGRRKTDLFLHALRQGIEPAPGAKELLERLRQVGIGIAVASSSEHCAAVLHATKLDRLVDTRVDGVDAKQLGLPGKPNPALFLEAARRLGVEPSHAILFEDALAGIEAGRRGGFHLVVGVDRGRQQKDMHAYGADVVVGSLKQVEVLGA